MSCGTTTITWAGVEGAGGRCQSPDDPGTSQRAAAGEGSDELFPEADQPSFLGRAVDDRLACATDPFDDFDDDDFDDEFDDDFEEEWDEELPGDADQFEPDEVQEKEGGLPVEPDFEDED